MEKQLNSLTKIFSEKLFRIPDYQRGYAWTERELNDFWNDIDQLEISRSHYTGVLTLEEVPEEKFAKWEDDLWIIKSKGFQAFFIVDGQQRLTTIIILIQCILEKLKKNETLNFTTRSDIQKKFIFESMAKGPTKSYLFGYERDNPSYDFFKSRILKERVAQRTLQETVYTFNLEQAKFFFTEKLNNFSKSQLETIYTKITQNLLFNIFTITKEIDVFVAFETMNNRGKELSFLELLKNRLIYLSTRLQGNEEIEKESLRKTINEAWKVIYHNLGKNKKKPLDDDSFLFHHSLIYFGSSNSPIHSELTDFLNLKRSFNQKNYLNNLLHNFFIPKNITSKAKTENSLNLEKIYKYVTSLQDTVETWYKLFNPKNSNLHRDIQTWLEKLNRLGIEEILPILLVWFSSEKQVKESIDLLKNIERFSFTQFILPRARPTQFHRFVASISKKPQKDYFALIMEQFTITYEDANLENYLKVYPTLYRKNKDGKTEVLVDSIEAHPFIESLRERGFYRWPGIYYFLFEYNLHLQAKTKNQSEKIIWEDFAQNPKDYETIEHILPQNHSAPYWKERFGHLSHKQRAALVDSLGNLLPLSRPKNSSLSNKSFPEKIGDQSSTVGYKFGSFSEIEISNFPEWTPQTILQRGLKLLEFMEERWNINLGNDRQKKYLLGLEFLD